MLTINNINPTAMVQKIHYKNNNVTINALSNSVPLFTAKIVNCKYAHFTKEATSNSSTLALLPEGIEVNVLGMNNNFYKVSYKGNIGYINYQYLSETTGNNFNGQVTYDNQHIIYNGESINQLNETSPAIVNMANKVCANATTNVEKAKAIYVWIAQNISYSKSIENALDNNTATPNESTATYTFNHRTGICEGYAQLYADMCRAEGLQVRVVSGLSNGGSGDNWGGHAWNQVYLPSLGTSTGWVNVDCTFASSAYTPRSEGGAGMSKSNTSYILNPNTITEAVTSVTTKQVGNTIYTTTNYKTWGNLDYFNNPENFNKSHIYQSIVNQGFATIRTNHITPSYSNFNKTTSNNL